MSDNQQQTKRPMPSRSAGDPTFMIVLLLAASLLIHSACASASNAAGPTPTPALPEEIIFYNWSSDHIESVFDEFTAEYGIRVTYLTYNSQEEALANMAAGVVYDMVVMENQSIPALVDQGLLAEIDLGHLPNFKNLSPNFRDLAHDPGNVHSIPYSWGTIGLVVRDDLAHEPVHRWSDMWKPRYAGRIVNWALPRYALGAALLSLGYSVNSEEPAELEAALTRLIELKPNTLAIGDGATVVPHLLDGKGVMGQGRSNHYWMGRNQGGQFRYVLPEEGAILWNNNFVIPANSPNKCAAELLLNFILRPEISARIINKNYSPMANEAARGYIQAEILNDLVIYPPNASIRNAEPLLPLSPEGERLREEIWARYLAANPQ